MRLEYEPYQAPHSTTIRTATTAKKPNSGDRSARHASGACRSRLTAVSTIRFIA